MLMKGDIPHTVFFIFGTRCLYQELVGGNGKRKYFFFLVQIRFFSVGDSGGVWAVLLSANYVGKSSLWLQALSSSFDATVNEGQYGGPCDCQGGTVRRSQCFIRGPQLVQMTCNQGLHTHSSYPKTCLILMSIQQQTHDGRWKMIANCVANKPDPFRGAQRPPNIPMFCKSLLKSYTFLFKNQDS